MDNTRRALAQLLMEAIEKAMIKVGESGADPLSDVAIFDAFAAAQNALKIWEPGQHAQAAITETCDMTEMDPTKEDLAEIEKLVVQWR